MPAESKPPTPARGGAPSAGAAPAAGSSSAGPTTQSAPLGTAAGPAAGVSAQEAAAARVGSNLGPFRITAVRRVEPKATVLDAVETTLDRPVMLRVVPAAEVECVGVDEFLRELRTVCRRDPVGAQSILQIGRSGADYFVAMQPAASGETGAAVPARPAWMMPAAAVGLALVCFTAGFLVHRALPTDDAEANAVRVDGGRTASDGVADAGKSDPTNAETDAAGKGGPPQAPLVKAPAVTAPTKTADDEPFEPLLALKSRKPTPKTETAPIKSPRPAVEPEGKPVEPPAKVESKSEPDSKVGGRFNEPAPTVAPKAPPTVAKVEPKPAEPAAKVEPKVPESKVSEPALKSEPKATEPAAKTEPKVEPKAVKPADFALREPTVGKPDLSASVAAAIEKARENLFKLQQDAVLVVHGGGQTTVAVEWKDVQVDPTGHRVRIKGRIFDNVTAVLPAGWFAEKDGPAGVANAFRVEHTAGHSALVTAALLASGVDPAKDVRMRKAVESQANLWLAGNVVRNAAGANLVQGPSTIYSIGLRAVCLELALRKVHGAGRAELLRALKRDALLLAGGHSRDGGYSYFPTPAGTAGGWDMSNCQYGVLGLWAASMVPEVEISPNTWALFNRFYISQQSKDGGWGYTGRGGSYPEMTAAGLASLFLVLDFVYTRTRGSSGPEVAAHERDPMLQQTLWGLSRGLEQFGRTIDTPWHGYLRYGIERVGVASGHKYFGNMDWFRRGAEDLLARQAVDGGWTVKDAAAGARILDPNDARETAWNLLFLVYGGAPVLINKLRYGQADDWTWANYPRDAANLARWNAQTFEEPSNWQIVDPATGTEDDLLDAPLLYISGHKALAFTDAQVERIRRYIERGGTVVAAVNGGPTLAAPFVRSIEDLARRLYPPAEFPQHRLGVAKADHPVYAMGAVIDSPAAPKAAVSKIPMRHMHNGRRSFLFLILEDIQHAWHSRRMSARPEAFSLAANIKRYALDKGPLWAKGRADPQYVDPPAPVGKLRLGVLKFESDGVAAWYDPADAGKPSPQTVRNDWNGLPGTWKAYAPWFRAAAGYEIEEVRGVDPATADLKSFDLLYMGGQYAFRLPPVGRERLKAYLVEGGTLLAEQINGRDPTGKRPFFDSVKAMLSEMFPETPPKALHAGAPLIAGRLVGRDGFDCSTVSYSRAATLSRDGNTACALTAVELDGRPAVVLSAYDLSTALSGQAAFDREGLGTDSARKLAANILVWAARTAAAARPAPG